jgi:nitrite reductase/ring-hydroxylating ferredoxin subunit
MRIKIGNLQTWKEKETRTFKIKVNKKLTECFAIRVGKNVYAYANQCKHIPLPLDFGDGDFLTNDRKYFLCKNHGAIYELKTGLCVAGPCSGDSLDLLKIEIIGDDVFCVS